MDLAARSLQEKAAAARAGLALPAPVDPLARYAEDPVGFARDVLGVRLWGRQRAIAEAFVERPLVTVRSGHKTGKTVLVCVLAAWYAAVHPRAAVVLTSASAANVKNQIWRELRKVWHSADGERLFGAPIHLDPSNGVRWTDGRLIVGVSVNEPERLAGYSGQVAIFVDEASNLEPSLWETIRGNLLGAGSKAMLTGNPIRCEGPFYASHHGPASVDWSRHQLSSLDTPNMTGSEDPIPGLADPEAIEPLIRECGGTLEAAKSHPMFRRRVLGEFTEESEDQIMGPGLIQAALDRYSPHNLLPGKLVLGVDPARFGSDESVIQPARGHYVYPAEAHTGLDGFDLGAKVLDVADRLRTPGGRVRVVVDEIGVGASVVDYLRRQSGVDVIAVNVGEASTELGENGTPVYRRLRDQLWGECREYLAAAALPPDDRRDAELMAATYSYDHAGRKIVSSKDELRKRLGRSPDRADALCLVAHAIQGGGGSTVAYYRPARPMNDRRMRVPRMKRGRCPFI